MARRPCFPSFPPDDDDDDDEAAAGSCFGWVIPGASKTENLAVCWRVMEDLSAFAFDSFFAFLPIVNINSDLDVTFLSFQKTIKLQR